MGRARHWVQFKRANGWGGGQHTTLIPALQHSGGRDKQISEFEARLFYRASSKTAKGYTENPCLEKEKKKGQGE